MLPSYGLSYGPREYGKESPFLDPFYGMPPVPTAQIHPFIPLALDYPVLLLYDRMIIDGQSLDLFHHICDVSEHPYSGVAKTMQLLEAEDYLRIEDFQTIIEKNRALIEAMAKRDLSRLLEWGPALEESIAAWRNIVDSATDSVVHSPEIAADHISRHTVFSLLLEDTWLGRDPLMRIHRSGRYGGRLPELDSLDENTRSLLLKLLRIRWPEDFLRGPSGDVTSFLLNSLRISLEEKFSYVNANLILSETFNCGFYDWYDYLPLYREKFCGVGRDDVPWEEKIHNVKRLFAVSFPEFTPQHPKDVIRALNDKRIVELRNLVERAAKGEVTFDSEFARRTLLEILEVEREVDRFRNFASYATLPLDFIPWVGTLLQKTIEEGLTRLEGKKLRKKFQWFYMISELAERSKARTDKKCETK